MSNPDPTLDSLILAAVEAAGPSGMRPVDLISTLSHGTKDSIRGRVKALKAQGALLNPSRGVYVTRGNVSPIQVSAGAVYEDGTIAYPVAPNGHGASETGRVNDDATPGVVRIPPMLMRRLLGGRLPFEGTWSFASGTSAEPYIPNGHPIFIEPAVGPFIDGERYAIWLGEAEADIVKRIELADGGGVLLKADNPKVSNRLLKPTEDPEEWRTETGGTIRMVVRGLVTFPTDTMASMVGELREFAMALIQARA